MICASLRWTNITEHLLICAFQTKVTFYFISSPIIWKFQLQINKTWRTESVFPNQPCQKKRGKKIL